MVTATFEDLHKKYKDNSSSSDNIKSIYTKEDIEKATIGLEENVDTPLEDRKFILDPILPVGGSMMIFGEAGVGKSYFTFNLAYALSCGGKFLKYGVPHPQKVAYFDGELGKNEVARYIREVIKNHEKTEFPDNLKTVSYDQFKNQNIPRIETNTQIYFDYIMDNGFDGGIWDNLVTCTDIDENNPKEWKPIQNLILRLRHHNKFFIFVHHAATNQTKERGISTRRDVIQAVIALEKIDDVICNDNRIKVSHLKGRHLRGSEKHPFEAVNKIDGTWEYIDIEKSNYDLVIDCLNAGYSGKDTAKHVKISPGMVTKYKNKAFLEGKLTKK